MENSLANAAGRAPSAGAGGAERRLALPASRSVLAVLVAIAAAFAVATLGLRLVERQLSLPAWLAQLDTAEEANAATWFSSAMLLAAAALVLALAVPRRWILAATLLVLSLDETAQLHEGTAGPVKQVVGGLTGSGGTVARGLAVAVAAAVLVAVAAFFYPWLRSLARPLRRRVTLAAAIYVTGAFGLEVGARMLETAVGGGEGVSAYVSIVEELAEMVGVAMLIAALAPCLACFVLPRATADGD